MFDLPKQESRAAVQQAGTIWTPDVEARALQLFLLEGFTASEVAAALGGGLTRSAVIAKIRRLGFRKRDDAPPRGRAAGRKPRCRPCLERRAWPAWPPIPLPPLREVPATGRPATLAGLGEGACRWPIDDPGPDLMHLALFCAGPAGSQRYCPAHQALAARPASGTAAP